MSFPGATAVKNLPGNTGDTRGMGSTPASGRSPGGGNGNPLQYSCLEYSTDRGAWRATVHRMAKSQTQLTDWAQHHVWARILTRLSYTCRNIPWRGFKSWKHLSKLMLWQPGIYMHSFGRKVATLSRLLSRGFQNIYICLKAVSIAISHHHNSTCSPADSGPPIQQSAKFLKAEKMLTSALWDSSSLLTT